MAALVLAFGCFSNAPPATLDDTPEGGELAIIGNYYDVSAVRFEIDQEQYLESGPAGLYEAVSVDWYDNSLRALAGKNSQENEYQPPGLYSRIDWIVIEGILWVCLSGDDEATLADAKALPRTDDAAPWESGCGGRGSWTELERAKQ